MMAQNFNIINIKFCEINARIFNSFHKKVASIRIVM